jgi:hypothetical protein
MGGCDMKAIITIKFNKVGGEDVTQITKENNLQGYINFKKSVERLVEHMENELKNKYLKKKWNIDTDWNYIIE